MRCGDRLVRAMAVGFANGPSCYAADVQCMFGSLQHACIYNVCHWQARLPRNSSAGQQLAAHVEQNAGNSIQHSTHPSSKHTALHSTTDSQWDWARSMLLQCHTCSVYALQALCASFLLPASLNSSSHHPCATRDSVTLSYSSKGF